MARINNEDTVWGVIEKMAEGNEGATTILMNLATRRNIEVMVLLDKHEIYGEQMYQFVKDVCGACQEPLLALLTALDQGWITKEDMLAGNCNVMEICLLAAVFFLSEAAS